MNWPNIIICVLMFGILIWAFVKGFDDYNDFE